MGRKALGTFDNNISLKDRSLIEGRALDGTFGITPTSYSFDGGVTPEANGVVAAGNAIFGHQVLLTRVAIALRIDLWASADVYGVVTCGKNNAGIRRVFGPAGLTLTDLNGPVFPKEYISAGLVGTLGNATPQALVRPTTPAGNKILLTGSYQAWYISADLEFNRSQSIYFLGDSNTEASAIAANLLAPASTISRNDVYSWKLKNFLNSIGNDVRIIDKSISGKSTKDFESYRIAGQLDLLTPPELVFYVLGTNDTDPAAYEANLMAYLSEYHQKWTDTKFLILGPAPLQGVYAAGSGPISGTSKELMMAQIRTKGETVVNTFNSPRVKYLNLGEAWAIGENQYYSGTEAAGSGVHWGVTGHDKIFTFLRDKLNTPAFAAFRKL
jgi:lysophospholipase L1-like esterase